MFDVSKQIVNFISVYIGWAKSAGGVVLFMSSFPHSCNVQNCFGKLHLLVSGTIKVNYLLREMILALFKKLQPPLKL